MKLSDKVIRLTKRVREMESVLIAFSGGVDSSFLAAFAKSILSPDKVLAVTVKAVIHPLEEFNAAKKIAKELKLPWDFFEINPLKIPEFKNNRLDRCYYCKREILSRMKKIAYEKGYRFVIEGSNYDDRKAFRPGQKALKEIGVLSPLLEAGLTKDEIRFLGKKYGLPNWNKPSNSCLVTRIPYNELLTAEKIKKIGNLEMFLKKMKINQVRVRRQKDLIRIETAPEDINKIISNREKIIRKFRKEAAYITLDLAGYRSGSMDIS